MKGNMGRRLNLVEKQLKPPGDDQRGTIKIHYTEAWPPSDKTNGAGLKHCNEHDSRCAVSISHTQGTLRRVYILRGPWLGIG